MSVDIDQQHKNENKLNWLGKKSLKKTPPKNSYNWNKMT